jgi:hypothetical protein
MHVRSTLLVLSLLALPVLAQEAQLPRPSPYAKVTQTIGLTDVTVDYSSPGVKGRKIWGAVVPLDAVWRAGANATTKVTFSKDVSIGGVAVPAGSYALFVLPTKAGFTFIINKDFMQGGSFKYNKDLDVVRVDVKPTVVPLQERLAYGFSDFSDNEAKLDLTWEKVRLSLPIKLNTEAQVAATMKKMLEGAWEGPNNVARYLLSQKKDLDKALAAADKSISIEETWLNVWTKAQLLAAKGDTKAAYPLAQKAQALGEKAGDDFFAADGVKQALIDWKPKT